MNGTNEGARTPLFWDYRPSRSVQSQCAMTTPGWLEVAPPESAARTQPRPFRRRLAVDAPGRPASAGLATQRTGVCSPGVELGADELTPAGQALKRLNTEGVELESGNRSGQSLPPGSKDHPAQERPSICRKASSNAWVRSTEENLVSTALAPTERAFSVFMVLSSEVCSST